MVQNTSQGSQFHSNDNMMTMVPLTKVDAPPNASRRSNSEDFHKLGPEQLQQQLDLDYSLQRAASSEAMLPSRHPGVRLEAAGSGRAGSEERDDDSTASGSHESYSSVPRHNSLLHQSHSFEPSKLEKPQRYTRCKSDSPVAKRLQTIESGISLADSTAKEACSPKPPLHPTNEHRQSIGSLPPLLPDDDRETIGRPEQIRKRLQSDQTAHSMHSYYSVDAGKHGFLVHRQNSDDGDSIANNSANDSLVFKYVPGEMTPPAEYALPASILRVYGDDVTPVENEMQNGHGMPWHHTAGSEGTDNSKSSIFYSPDSDEESNPKEVGMVGSRNGSSNKSTASPRESPHGIPHLMASPDDDSVDRNPHIVLPYHERKRLLELEEEEKRRKKEARMQKQQARVDRVNRKDSERTPLTNNRRDIGYGTSIDTDNSEQKDANAGWFGKLVSIVTGNDEGKERSDSIEEYRSKGEEFLRKTEKERTKLLEERRMDELNNVTIPVTKQSFGGHSRAKMSSLSNLDSIPSVSDDECEETESSDEESGHYWTEQEEEPQSARVWRYGEPPTNPTKAATGRSGNAPTKKKPSKKASGGSQRDRSMRRERLMQEEYEYRLRSLRRENDKLSKKFRVFVLVAVALIFAGALAFAFAVCVRMLMSI